MREIMIKPQRGLLFSHQAAVLQRNSVLDDEDALFTFILFISILVGITNRNYVLQITFLIIENTFNTFILGRFNYFSDYLIVLVSI